MILYILSMSTKFQLDDWCLLTQDLHLQLTSWNQLVEKPPAYIGSHNVV